MGLRSARGTEADESYERLHQAILRRLSATRDLVEIDLAQRYNAGRAAIRTTLARLEQDGRKETPRYAHGERSH